MKIKDKIQKCIDEKKPFFSFEYFPPKTEAGMENLYERIDRMATLDPLFCDVTWGAGGKTADLTLQISSSAQNYCCVETMMHLTCTNMDVAMINEALRKAKEAGMQNILALRGDPPVGQERWVAVEEGLHHAVDLVKMIRKEHGDYFGIAVAGYPEGHTECPTYEEDLLHLKEKIDAGADFVITQLFYDVDMFLKYVQDCRALGIMCPIIPGLMPIHNYASFKRMTGFCKTKVPDFMNNELEAIKDDDEAVKNYGVHIGIQMCKRLLEAGTPGLHFFTLNLEKSVSKIIEGLKLVSNGESHRQLPWRPPTSTKRVQESVRPIFWANRPKSYLFRTATWDDYPNGRWGDHRSPAFGELNDYHLFYHAGQNADRKSMWGKKLSGHEAVWEVFVRFCRGEITVLPWCDQGIALETTLISRQLVWINANGFLTINSQPAVNGARSTDRRVGWGGPGGYVYQKAYLEFFTPLAKLEQLIVALNKFPSMTYMAVDHKGTLVSNCNKASVNAVTWGVFPAKEVLQPTVVDARSFLAWKDEAFALWKLQWGAIYPDGSPERNLISNMAETYYLVNIVDNDFVEGDIFRPFRDFLTDGPGPVPVIEDDSEHSFCS